MEINTFCKELYSNIKNRVSYKKFYLFFIFVFIFLIYLFGNSLQEKYYNFILPVLIILAVASFLYKKWRFSMADVIFVIYLISAAISAFFSINRNIAIHAFWQYFVPLPFIYFAAKNISNELIDECSQIFFFAGLCILLIGFLEWFFHKNIIYEGWCPNLYYHRFIYETPRIMSTQLHPTVFGSMLLGCIFFVYYLRFRPESRFKIIIGISILFFALGIIFSFSRGNVLGLIIGSAFYFLITHRLNYLKIMVILMIALILISSVIGIFCKNNSFNRFGLKALTQYWFKLKIERLELSIRMLQRKPLFGIGLNHFRLEFDNVSTPAYKEREKVKSSLGYDVAEWKIADNMYCTILAETGLFGFFSFILFLFFLLKKAKIILRKSLDKRKKEFTLVVFCAIIALLISMNSYDMFGWLNPLYLIWFLFGMFSSIACNFSG